LSPETLPSLMGGGLDKTLVLWCANGVDSDKAVAFTRLASEPDQDRVLAWFDRLVEH